MKQALIKRCSFLLFALMSIVSYAQNSSHVTVTGTVTDSFGGLIPGVNVTEKSTKNTVTTDYSGKYSIKVNSGGALVFSFIGMRKTEISLDGRTIVNAKMSEDSNQLDNIVVVGYGTQRKKELTGAIATINPETLVDLPVTNLSDALRGLVPGLNVVGGSGRPGDASSLQIRQTFGFSKDGSSTTPLIIIDDMIQIDPLTGRSTMDAFNRLDPSEIESISVLKDGSAAIYGSRASQGAIVVKTKRGKAGKAKFTYNSQFAVNDAVSHSKVLNAYDFGVFSNRYLTSLGKQNGATPGSALFSPTELDEMKGLDYNWLDEAWKPAIQQKHTFNVSGGSDDITYFAGATYFTQDGNMGSQKYDKWNFRTGITAKIAAGLDLSVSISGNTGTIDKTFSKASANISDGSYASAAGGEQADYGFLLHMPQYVPWQTTVEGKDYYVSPFPRTTTNLGSGNSNTTIAGWNYFATLANGSHQISDDNSLNVNASLNYKVAAVKGLSFKATFARTQAASYTEQIQLPYDLVRIKNHETAGNHLASEATPTFGANGGDYTLDTNNKNARVYYNNSNSKNTQGDFFVNYDRTFGDHQIGVMFGGEASETYNTTTRLAYENTSKDYLGTNVTAGTLNQGNSLATKIEGGTLSYFGRVNYNYKQKYLAQFLFRTDASTKFAPENYWGYFPSLQVGWVASKEDWFANNVSWVDFLKIRYSIGKTGNDNMQPWRWLQLYDVLVDKGSGFGTVNGGNNGAGLTPRVNPNRLAGWDATLKNNIGIDFNVLKNRLQFTADFYYDKKTQMLTDMGSAVGVPLSLGGGYAEENYSRVDDWGSEFGVNWSDKRNNFSYDVGMNFSYGNNEIKKFPDQGNLPPSSNVTQAGKSQGYNPVWGFATWKGTSTGDGILRTDADIANYWAYLTERATAVGGTPKYIDITDPTKIGKGSLAYQDVAGATLNADGSLKGPDGQITKENDYVKLANSSRTYTIITNLGFKTHGFYLKSQISTSWGGATFVDLVNQGTASAASMWSRESFWKDMYGADNPNGKYPNVAQWTYMSSPSDFWQVNTFRCFVRNLSVGYEIPKKAFADTKISSITLGVTGTNLWDLYNPYPDHYRNMYDNSSVGYPTLRTWALNFNVSF
jgi:TonB-linked SusC/RagA family outer membrane protein